LTVSRSLPDPNRPSTIFRAHRDGLDAYEIMEYHVVDGREQAFGLVALFHTPDGDPAHVARAEAYLAFLNEHGDERPYSMRVPSPSEKRGR
jgi:hypothetical protein